MPLAPASGVGAQYIRGAKIMRFVRHGCCNRPIFHIVLTVKRRGQYQPVIEQLGMYDPMPNMYNEKLVSINIDRIKHWLVQGSDMSKPVAELLGLSGLLPMHPITYMTAWRNRRNNTTTTPDTKEAESEAV